MVARLAKDGLSNPEIGARLFISPGTAKYHLSNVYTKLGISSRNQLDRVLPVGQRAGGHGAETADARAAPNAWARRGVITVVAHPGGEVDEVRSGEVRVGLLARAPVLVEGEAVGLLHALVRS
jgi:hypothetical protein